uniref:Arginine vasopressin-induced protein 1 n=1 Tax=Cyprinus carpio TaxID=7962 RepID=A0A8C1U9D9_CYPCA
MEDVASASVLAGPSQPTCSRPPGSERRKRKSGTANIFQGVNLRQLRRLFQAAGDPDAEQRAQMVWGNHRAASGEDGADREEDEDRAMAEVETGLAQALVGLRVRARNRSGLRVEAHKEGTGTRGMRGHHR